MSDDEEVIEVTVLYEAADMYINLIIRWVFKEANEKVVVWNTTAFDLLYQSNHLAEQGLDKMLEAIGESIDSFKDSYSGIEKIYFVAHHQHHSNHYSLVEILF